MRVFSPGAQVGRCDAHEGGVYCGAVCRVEAWTEEGWPKVHRIVCSVERPASVDRAR